jgi:hypothetical protein
VRFAAVDFPQGDYKHDIHESTSTDGIHWTPPSPPVLENAYAPAVIKEDGKYRMWFVDPSVHPWCLRHAESQDGTAGWKVSEKPCIVMDQAWEKKDLVYRTVTRVDGVYVMM